VAGMQDAPSYARQIYEQVAGEYADAADLGLYLARVVAELFEMSPGAREHISDLVIAEHVEELSRRGEEEAMRAVLRVQRDWSSGDMAR
jgi:hypothetical protein